jgi:glycosyltransferase involved in cell wall biosynthesis
VIGSAPTPSPQVLISVVLPALNEERFIAQCLQCLANQEFPRAQFEVLVMDNASTDRTSEIAAGFLESLPIAIYENKNTSISSVRNAGARLARGRHLAFLDADCLVPQDWIANAVTLFADLKPCVLGAPYGIPERSTWVGKSWYQHQQRKLGSVSYVPGGTLMISKQDFTLVGGFDESLQTNEDYEFCQRAFTAGLPILAFAELQVCHLGTPQTLTAFYQKQRWHGKHVFKVFFRSLPRLRNLMAVAFAFYVLSCIFGLAAGLVILVGMGRWEVTSFFAVALLAPPIALSVRSNLRREGRFTFLPLAMLLLTFGVARAACLMGFAMNRAAGVPLAQEGIRHS